MLKKIGTVLDTSIIEKLKIVCAKKHKPMKDIIEDALRIYLQKEDEPVENCGERRLISLNEVLSSQGGEFVHLALGGKGSGDFDEKDFD